jgi:hypothetical protein
MFRNKIPGIIFALLAICGVAYGVGPTVIGPLSTDSTSVAGSESAPSGSNLMQVGTTSAGGPIIQQVVGTQTAYCHNIRYNGSWDSVTTGDVACIRMDQGLGGITWHLGSAGGADETQANWDTSDVVMKLSTTGLSVGPGTTSQKFGVFSTTGSNPELLQVNDTNLRVLGEPFNASGHVSRLALGPNNDAGIQHIFAQGVEVLSSTGAPIVFSDGTFASNTANVTISGVGAFTVHALGTGDVQATSGLLSVTSDERVKDNIKPFTRGLKSLVGLQPIEYNWAEGFELDTDVRMTGFGANQVENHIPEAVTHNPRTGYKGLQSRAILATAVNAIKELKEENDMLKAWICDEHAAPFCVGE